MSAGRELAEVAGGVRKKVVVSGGEFVLAPMNLNSFVEFEENVGSLQTESTTAKGVRYQLYLCAKNAGYEGTIKEIGGAVVTIEDLDTIRAAIEELQAGNAKTPGANTDPAIGQRSSGS